MHYEKVNCKRKKTFVERRVVKTVALTWSSYYGPRSGYIQHPGCFFFDPGTPLPSCIGNDLSGTFFPGLLFHLVSLQTHTQMFPTEPSRKGKRKAEESNPLLNAVAVKRAKKDVRPLCLCYWFNKSTAVHCYALTSKRWHQNEGITVTSPRSYNFRNAIDDREAPCYQIDFRGLASYRNINIPIKIAIRRMINNSKNTVQSTSSAICYSFTATPAARFGRRSRFYGMVHEEETHEE